MRIIELKEFDQTILTKGGEKIVRVKDREILVQCAQYVDQERGIRVRDMGRALDLEDKIKAESNGRLILEDTDWELLCAKIDAMPFSVVGRDVYDLTQRVVKAPFKSPSDFAKMKEAEAAAAAPAAETPVPEPV